MRDEEETFLPIQMANKLRKYQFSWEKPTCEIRVLQFEKFMCLLPLPPIFPIEFCLILRENDEDVLFLQCPSWEVRTGRMFSQFFQLADLQFIRFLEILLASKSTPNKNDSRIRSILYDVRCPVHICRCWRVRMEGGGGPKPDVDKTTSSSDGGESSWVFIV